MTYSVILSGIWIFRTGRPADQANGVFTEYFYVGIISIFFLLELYLGYKRIIRRKEGLPEEDEMSKKIAQKAAATSFYLSLLLWLVLIYVQDKITADIRILFGYGMIGMALIYVFSWFYYNFTGATHE